MAKGTMPPAFLAKVKVKGKAGGKPGKDGEMPPAKEKAKAKAKGKSAKPAGH